MSKTERWSLIFLEVLFGLCALSVIVYQFTGRFDFGFGIFSYRFFNIAISLAVVAYIVFGLLKSRPHVLTIVVIFSLFHLTEGLIISFLTKSAIHLLILSIVGWHYYRNKTLKLEAVSQSSD